MVMVEEKREFVWKLLEDHLALIGVMSNVAAYLAMQNFVFERNSLMKVNKDDFVVSASLSLHNYCICH